MAQLQHFYKRKAKAIELLVVAAVTAAIWYLVYLLQPIMEYERVALADGHQYLLMHNCFKTNDCVPVRYPYSLRLLVPWLASVYPAETPLKSFLFVNFWGSVIAMPLMVWLWQLVQVSRQQRVIGTFIVLTHFIGVVRYNIFDPIAVDVPLYIFQPLFLIIILKKKYYHLLWLAPLATVQKESFIGLLTVWILFEYLWNTAFKNSVKWLLIPLVALVLAVLVKQLAGARMPNSNSFGFMLEILYNIKLMLLNPTEILRALAALFTAYGAFLYLGIKNFGSAIFYQKERTILVLCIVYLGFGFVAGRDATRIFFLGAPFLLTYLLICTDKVPCKLVWLVILLTLPMYHLYEIMDVPAYTEGSFENWLPKYASLPKALLINLYSIIAIAVTAYFYKRWQGGELPVTKI